MKKKLFSILTLACIVAIFTACDTGEEPKPTPTNLKLTIKNKLGNLVSGATVKLFSSEMDLAKETNQIGSTKISDASGVVEFSDLSAIKYYWMVEKDCENNVNGGVSTTTALTSNKTNSVDVILSETGTLVFNNLSSNSYRVYINGVAKFDMNGGTTQTYSYNLVGTYTLRVLQLNGYLVYPTDKTYSGNLSCGSTLTLNFPD